MPPPGGSLFDEPKKTVDQNKGGWFNKKEPAAEKKREIDPKMWK